MTVEELQQYRVDTRRSLKLLKNKTSLRYKNLPTINPETFPSVEFNDLKGSYNLLSKTVDIQDRILTFYEEIVQKFKQEALDEIKCPTKTELSKYVIKREAIVNALETLSTTVKIINLPLLLSLNSINTTEKLISTVTVLKTTYSTALAATPVAPGITTSLLSILDDLVTNLKFTQVGEPKITKLKSKVGNISKILQLIQEIIVKTLKYLQDVDKLLIQCGGEVTDLGPNLKEVAFQEKVNLLNNTITSNYKGFTFKIKTKPFSKSLDQKIGQAVNSENIVVLETEPSFTDNPETLIEELKFIIDRDNLKAY